MNKILLSLLTISLVAVVAVSATRAYFFDTETSTGNSFTAGTLDLKVDGADDPIPAKISVPTMKPGGSGSVIIALHNDGNIDGGVLVKNTGVTNSEGDNPEPETDKTEPGDLGGALITSIKYDADNDGTFEVSPWPGSGTGSVFPTLDSQSGEMFGSLFGPTDMPLAKGDTRNMEISWEIPTGTGNEIMGDTASFALEFHLEQVHP